MVKDESKETPDEIKINDKRRFTDDGSAKEEDLGEVRADAGQEPSSETEGAAKDSTPLPAIDFPTFVLSLATSAQVHLGMIANPGTGKQAADLPLAKQTIDILGVLQEKTKGNLSEDEDRLLEHLLYDLRVMYIEKGK